MELGNEALIDERRPMLPGIEHLCRLVPRPGHAEECHVADGSQVEGERRGDAEVAAAAATQGPEEIRLLLSTDMHQGAIGSDQVNREEVVAGEAVLARQEPEPA